MKDDHNKQFEAERQAYGQMLNKTTAFCIVAAVVVGCLLMFFG